MACILANILVATRLTYSMARDNMLPFSHVWRHVSPTNRTPTYAVLGLFGLSTVLLLSALVSEKAFFLILGLSSLAVFATYVLQTIALIIGHRRGTIPAAEPGTFDLGRARMPVYVVGLVVFSAVCAALIFLPQFAGNKLGVPRARRARRPLGGDRAARAAGRRRRRTELRQDPPLLNSLTHSNFEGTSS